MTELCAALISRGPVSQVSLVGSFDEYTTATSDRAFILGLVDAEDNITQPTSWKQLLETSDE